MVGCLLGWLMVGGCLGGRVGEVVGVSYVVVGTAQRKSSVANKN